MYFWHFFLSIFEFMCFSLHFQATPRYSCNYNEHNLTRKEQSYFLFELWRTLLICDVNRTKTDNRAGRDARFDTSDVWCVLVVWSPKAVITLSQKLLMQRKGILRPVKRSRRRTTQFIRWNLVVRGPTFVRWSWLACCSFDCVRTPYTSTVTTDVWRKTWQSRLF